MYENHVNQKTAWLVLIVAIVFALAAEIPAAVPQLINYQGRLTNSVGVPLDTIVELTFTIYSDSTGSIDLWTETHSGVVVQDGLFQVLLGSIDPIAYKVFEDGQRRWLGIQMKGSPAPTTFIPIVSVAYSYHSKSADTATYATNGGSSGWVDEGTTVRLSTIGDSVGIGTSNPALRLDVAGGLRATDSVQTNKLVLGKSSTTTGALNMYSNLALLPIVQLSGSSTGGTVQVRDEAGNSSAYLKSSTEPGGLLSIARNAAGSSGFYVDGNLMGTEEPVVNILGSTRSAIFDMSESGDLTVQLPSSSISSSECQNEAGLAIARRSSGSVTLDNTVKTILSRSCSFPSSGHVLVIGTLYYDFWHYAGTGDWFQFGVSDVAGSFPADQDFSRNYSANWSTFNYQDFVTVQGYFAVDAGVQTFYLLGQAVATGNPWAGDAYLSVLFFPTNYFAPKGQDNSNNPEQEQLDAMIQKRIDVESAKLREELDAKLKAIQEDMKRQLDNSGGK